MTPGNARAVEHLATNCNLSLEDFCTRLRAGLALPAFEFDAENETEWGMAKVGDLEINVSRPYTPGTLQAWDPSTPDGCNFAVLLITAEAAPLEENVEWTGRHLVPRYAQAIADSIGVDVYHHSVWFQGKLRTQPLTVYRPSARK